MIGWKEQKLRQFRFGEQQIKMLDNEVPQGNKQVLVWFRSVWFIQ